MTSKLADPMSSFQSMLYLTFFSIKNFLFIKNKKLLVFEILLPMDSLPTFPPILLNSLPGSFYALSFSINVSSLHPWFSSRFTNSLKILILSLGFHNQ